MICNKQRIIFYSLILPCIIGFIGFVMLLFSGFYNINNDHNNAINLAIIGGCMLGSSIGICSIVTIFWFINKYYRRRKQIIIVDQHNLSPIDIIVMNT